MPRFAHLHVHSDHSMLIGPSTIPDLCAHAAALGYASLALTDTNGLYGAIPFQTAAEKLGLKPIFGAQIKTNREQAVLLAKNAAGYAALCRAITNFQLQEESFFLLKQLIEDRNGVIVLATNTDWLQQIALASGTHDLFEERRACMPRKTPPRFPPVATGPVYFARPNDFALHRILRAIDLNTSLSRLPPEEVATQNCWLQSFPEIAKQFQTELEALQNAALIAEQCNFRIPTGKLQLPKYHTPAGVAAHAHLRQLCDAGVRKRYGEYPAAVRKQLDHEMSIVREMGYADYFLIVAEIVHWAEQQGFPTCGRGSAANSIIAYTLGLTHVEPLRHNLYFERFLNRGRSDAPDIDMDFAWDQRDKVIDFVYRHWGSDRVAMIATHVTFALRGALREVAKVAGIPLVQVDKVAKRLHHLDYKLFDAQPWQSVYRYARKLIDHPKHLGIHAGGVIIAPHKITEHVPLQYASKETELGRRVVTQWDMYPIEDVGLVKIDLLGNRSLAVIRDAAQRLQERGQHAMNWHAIKPIDDSKTRQLIRDGKTMGCFYIESPAMRQLLTKLRCDSFDMLVAASSIVRPGVASSGMMAAFIERFHGKPWQPLHPKMEELLSETYGIMAYQEDVIRITEALVGFSPEDADGLRRAMAKKRNHESIKRFQQKFLQGAKKNHIAEHTAEEIWRQIESFAGYSFSKAHSASYALVSFQAAWLKAHYPAQFMAAVMSNHGGFYSTFAYVAECWRMGLKLLSPCVNCSAVPFEERNGAIRVGLAEIGGLSVQGIAAILQARKAHGPFHSFANFMQRVALEPRAVEALIRSGAFDNLPEKRTRPERMWQLVEFQHCAKSARTNLFNNAAQKTAALPKVREFNQRRILFLEQETLGFLVSEHPLKLYAHEIARSAAIRAIDLPNYIGQTVRLVGWEVTAKYLRTKHGDPMEFLTFEDTTDIFETTMFPQAYKKYAPWMFSRGPYLIEGTVQEEFGHVSLIISKVRLINYSNK